MFWIKLIFKQKHMKYSPAMTLMINEGKKNPNTSLFLEG